MAGQQHRQQPRSAAAQPQAASGPAPADYGSNAAAQEAMGGPVVLDDFVIDVGEEEAESEESDVVVLPEDVITASPDARPRGPVEIPELVIEAGGDEASTDGARPHGPVEIPELVIDADGESEADSEEASEGGPVYLDEMEIEVESEEP